MTEPRKDPPSASPSTTIDPDEATGLQTGVGQILVDHELDQGKTTKIPQPKRKRVIFKA